MYVYVYSGARARESLRQPSWANKEEEEEKREREFEWRQEKAATNGIDDDAFGKISPA